MSANNTVYLVSGSTRGIGLGIVTDLVKRDNVLVFAGARDPEAATELKQLQTIHKNLHIVKLSSTSEEDAKTAAEQIERTAGKLDVVIANAGIAYSYINPGEVSLSDVREHFEVNTIGPLILYQATRNLLKKSSNPKFIVISTSAGSIAIQDKMPPAFVGVAYGTSKAAVNYVTKRIHLENHDSNLTAFVVHPGWVQTEMGNYGAKVFGMEKADITLQESIDGLLKVFDQASREGTGGKFLDYTGAEVAW
jgi:norsolorinic acid ketoreductase